MSKIKVILWGHRLHSHTHSYIHEGFYRCFLRMGHEVHWFDNKDDVSGFDFSNCLFITEGQVWQKMPIVKSSKYILHNCYDTDEVKKWDKIKEENIKYLKLQTFTFDCLGYNYEKVEECIYFGGDILFMPWATDLMPEDIVFTGKPDSNESWWVGTMGDGEFGNNNELDGFRKACHENGIKFCHANNLSVEENIQKIRQSYMAPAIVGTWQKRVGYLPCRIFKNISYGQLGLTNSSAVKQLLGEYVIYEPDEYKLFHLGKEAIERPDYHDRIRAGMEHIKNHHIT